MRAEGDRPALITPHRTWSWPALVRAARALPPVAVREVVDDDPQAAVLALVAAALGRGPAMILSHRWPEARRRNARDMVNSARLPPGAASVLFTSGSSGAPKAVVHTVDNHIAGAAGAHARLPFAPPDAWLLSLPLSHIGGAALVFRALCTRATLIAPAANEGWLEATARGRPTHLSLVAAQLRVLLDHGVPHRGPILVGGGPVPAPLLTEALDAGRLVRATWGMTETCAQVCTAEVGDVLTAGRPLPGREVEVRDGRLYVRGPMLAAACLVDGRRVALTDDEGWFDTGDRGHLDAEGRVTVFGRADAQFVSGGENIRPEDIERVLLTQVREACVVDVPDPRWGRRPVAFVEPYAPREALAGTWADAMPRFMWPDHVWPFPERGSLKPDRRRLRRWATMQLGDARVRP